MKKLFSVIILIFILFPAWAWGTTYWLRDASDGEYGTENGSSYANAFDGVADIIGVGAGDTLYVCGTITGELFDTWDSGSSGNQIVIDGGCPEDGVARATITAPTTDAIRLDQDYITFQNLIINAGTAQGMWTAGAARTGIVIDNCVFQNSGNEGVDIELNNSTIKNSVAKDNAGSGWVFDSGDTVVFRNVVAYGNGTDGANNHDGFDLATITNLDASGLLAYSNDSNDGSGIDLCGTTGVIKNSMSYGNDGNGLGVCGRTGSASTVTIQNVLTYNNGNAGIQAYAGQAGDNIYIYNCTIVADSGYPLRIGLSTDDADEQTVTAKNNVIEAKTGATHAIYLMDQKADYVGDDNIFYGGDTSLTKYNNGSDNNYTIAQWRTATGQDSNSSTSDPLLETDYKLQKDSPAIDAGELLSIHVDGWRDLYGWEHIFGTAPDIGAYEYRTTDWSPHFADPLNKQPIIADWYTP